MAFARTASSDVYYKVFIKAMHISVITTSHLYTCITHCTIESELDFRIILGEKFNSMCAMLY